MVAKVVGKVLIKISPSNMFEGVGYYGRVPCSIDFNMSIRKVCVCKRIEILYVYLAHYRI